MSHATSVTHEVELIRSRRMQKRQNHLAPILNSIPNIGNTKSDS